MCLQYCLFIPSFTLSLVVCVDGGKRDCSAEKNGDQRGGGREENGEEHGEHAGNVHGLPHRNTVCMTLFVFCFVLEKCTIKVFWTCTFLCMDSKEIVHCLVKFTASLETFENIPFILFFLLAGQLKVCQKGLCLPHRTLCGDATASLNCSERTFWSRTLTSSSLRYQRNGLVTYIWKENKSLLVGKFLKSPLANCYWIVNLAGRVRVAQVVCRQPRPGLRRATESRPGELLAARRVASRPFQWQNLLLFPNGGQHVHFIHIISIVYKLTLLQCRDFKLIGTLIALWHSDAFQHGVVDNTVCHLVNHVHSGKRMERGSFGHRLPR